MGHTENHLSKFIPPVRNVKNVKPQAQAEITLISDDITRGYFLRLAKAPQHTKHIFTG